MNDELEIICKEAVLSYFKVLLSSETEENHKKS
jgi:hypothetical protein